MQNTSKRVVVVTGGSGGIGRSICCSFSRPQTSIYFTYYSNKEAAKKTATLVANAGSSVYYRKVDVSCSKEVFAFFAFILKQTEHIDVLVNNSGINNDSLLIRLDEQSWNRVIDVNLKGTFNCTKAVSRTMIKQRNGRIINITSIVGLTGNSGQSNYAASKAGIIGLTKSVAKELANRSITVNAIAPGYINTAMTKKISNNSATILKRIPVRRLGEPDDISNVVYFLASKKASYITGQVINVTGGLYM